MINLLLEIFKLDFSLRFTDTSINQLLRLECNGHFFHRVDRPCYVFLKYFGLKVSNFLWF